MNLRTFLDRIAAAGELEVVSRVVSCDQQIAELSRKQFQLPSGGRALLFNHPEKSQFKIATNLFGSEQRLAELLHVADLDEFQKSLGRLLAGEKGSASERVKQLCRAEDSCQLRPLSLQSSADIDLSILPALKSWPEEGGSYLSLALTVTGDLRIGTANLGLYRAQILGKDRIALNFAPGSDTGKRLKQAQMEKEVLPVALFLGGDPALIWCAAAPLPSGCSEFSFYRRLFQESPAISDCISQPLSVPADAEVVIEGIIDPLASATEGPFANHTGNYVTRTDCPVMQVTAIHFQPDAVLPATIVGPPPSETVKIGQANLCLIRALLQIDFPQIVELSMPVETIFHSAVLLKVRTAGRVTNRELIERLWQEGPLQNSRLMVLLDEDIDINSAAQCWWRTVNMLNIDRIHHNRGRIAVDATGVDSERLVKMRNEN